MNPLSVAIRGYLCSNTPESIATRGYFCGEAPTPPKPIPIYEERRRGDAQPTIIRRSNDNQDMLDIFNIFLRCKN